MLVESVQKVQIEAEIEEFNPGFELIESFLDEVCQHIDLDDFLQKINVARNNDTANKLRNHRVALFEHKYHQQGH